jgi:PAS domain S-box-containing protein
MIGHEDQREKCSQRNNNRLFDLTIESVSDYAIFAMDREGCIGNWNKGAENLFGYKKEEITGKDFAILFTLEDRRHRIPERELETAIREGRGEDFRWHLRKDGSTFWATGSINTLKDDAGNLTGFIQVTYDATRRKLAAEALKESEANFRAIFEFAGTGMAQNDPVTGRLVRVNRKFCEFLGYCAEELLTKTVQEITYPEDWARDLAIYQRIARGAEEKFELDKRYVRKDGRIVWGHLSNVVRHDENQKLVLTIASIQDITERKQAEARIEELLSQEKAARDEAERANHSKDEFMAMVSHELRSPLTAILGWTRILHETRPDEELYERAIEIIERNARLQAELIEDLMDTARIVSGKLRLEVRPISMVQVIEKAMDVVRPAADAKAITLEATLDDEAGQTSGDPDRLQQVIWNLLSNAVKFTNEGGRVDVVLERSDPYVQITVRDTGKGIEPEFLPYVFERYRQGNLSNTGRTGGLGLGLSLARQLVEMHGGHITVQSEGKGKGATFMVTLPIRAVYTPETERDGAVIETKRLADVWAIVVDDEPDARELVKIVLESNGARVTEFGSTQETLDLLTDDSAPRPSVLVADLGLPGEDGLSLIRKLRNWERSHGVGFLPAIALTAFGSAADRRQTLLAGFQMHVAKPVLPSELVLAVRSMVLGGLWSNEKADQDD